MKNRGKLKRAILDVMALAFSKDHRVAVWWYELGTGRLEYNEEVRGHLDPMFIAIKNTRGWARGMVFVKGGTHNIVVYMQDSAMKDATNPAKHVTDIRNKISNKTGFVISNVVDEEGHSVI